MSHTSSNGENSPKSNNKVEGHHYQYTSVIAIVKTLQNQTMRVLIKFLIKEKMKVLGHRMKEDLAQIDMKDPPLKGC